MHMHDSLKIDTIVFEIVGEGGGGGGRGIPLSWINGFCNCTTYFTKSKSEHVFIIFYYM